MLALARAIAPPREVAKPIPYAAERKADMAAYAQRHYGIDDYRLRDPKVIVEHYTATSASRPSSTTSRATSPTPSCTSCPGVCSHYVIDRDGTIYRLVPTSIMCRHTVGLNWTAIGIEHVGQSDAQVMGNRRQLAASLRLTRALQGRYGIATRNVIGHNENRESPYHRERVARLRTPDPRGLPEGRDGRLPARGSARFPRPRACGRLQAWRSGRSPCSCSPASAGSSRR